MTLTTKKAVNLWIDRNVYEEFKELVFQIHGRLYGVLSDEATKALELWIEQHKDLRKVQAQYKDVPKLNKRQIKLLTFLYDFDEIQDTDIESFIRENIGIDKRTVKNYMDFLQRNEFITKDRELRQKNKVTVIIYRVNRKKIQAYLLGNGVQLSNNIATNNTKEELANLKETLKNLQNRVETAFSLLNDLEEEVKTNPNQKIILAYIAKIKAVLRGEEVERAKAIAQKPAKKLSRQSNKELRAEYDPIEDVWHLECPNCHELFLTKLNSSFVRCKHCGFSYTIPERVYHVMKAHESEMKRRNREVTAYVNV